MRNVPRKDQGQFADPSILEPGSFVDFGALPRPGNARRMNYVEPVDEGQMKPPGWINSQLGFLNLRLVRRTVPAPPISHASGPIWCGNGRGMRIVAIDVFPWSDRHSRVVDREICIRRRRIWKRRIRRWACVDETLQPQIGCCVRGPIYYSVGTFMTSGARCEQRNHDSPLGERTHAAGMCSRPSSTRKQNSLPLRSESHSRPREGVAKEPPRAVPTSSRRSTHEVSVSCLLEAEPRVRRLSPRSRGDGVGYVEDGRRLLREGLSDARRGGVLGQRPSLGSDLTGHRERVRPGEAEPTECLDFL